MGRKYRQKNRRRQRERRGWTVQQQREHRAAVARMKKRSVIADPDALIVGNFHTILADEVRRAIKSNMDRDVAGIWRR